MNPTPAVPIDDPMASFTDRLRAALDGNSFISAVLAKYRGPVADLQRVDLRCVRLRGQAHLQFVYQHTTRNITHNLSLDEAMGQVANLLGADAFRHAHLDTHTERIELTIKKRGQAQLRSIAAAPTAAAPADDTHNRSKQRMLSLDRPFLAALGVTTAQGQLIPAMARKWKQINKFLEVFAGALAASRLGHAKALRIADFGCGKGYLTFAVHDWLQREKQVEADVIGVELRPDMVKLCNAAIGSLGLSGLRIEQGDVRSWQPKALNAVIALHACDTATDHAIHLGLRAGADIILCSPCCHKQLRPQLLQPHPLRPILRHGVHLGQEAEMLTDGLRALLLEAAGYDTQVFEFVALEHTNKNKMILAVKRALPKAPDETLAQIAEIKAFYGIREHCLESLINQVSRPPQAALADNPA